jgi:hypothetical protein
MQRDDCLLIGRNDHVITVGSRALVFHWLERICPDGEYVVRGTNIDLSFHKISSVVYQSGGVVDGNTFPTRSLAECLSVVEQKG